MNEALCDKWVSCIKKGDTVYHLGDMGTYNVYKVLKVLRKLPGKKYLVPGNHDDIPKFGHLWKEIFCILTSMHEMKLDVFGQNQHFVLSHYPILEWNGYYRGSIMLHGHTHARTDNAGFRRIDVGVDNWEFAPVAVEKLIKQACEVPVPKGHPCK